MVTSALLKPVWEALEHSVLQEHDAGLETLPQDLADRIRAGTAASEEIDRFLRRKPQLAEESKQSLFLLKAWLLLRQGRADLALDCVDTALRIGDTSLGWCLKGLAVFQLGQPDVAFQAFQRAFDLEKSTKAAERTPLVVLLGTWGLAALIWGLAAVLVQDMAGMERGVAEYLGAVDKAKAEGLEAAIVPVPLPQNVSADLLEGYVRQFTERYAQGGATPTQESIAEWRQQVQDALDELELAVKLLSIKNPFDRWRAFTKEISKVWPEGVSALDAVREQRE